MKKIIFQIWLLSFFFGSQAQADLEISGQLKLNTIDTVNSEIKIMVADEDGLLSYRTVIKSEDLEMVESNQDFDYEGNYVDLGIGYQRGSFYKHKDRVYIQGSVKKSSGSPANGDVIAILPIGYRPTNRIIAYGSQNGIDHPRVDILTNGEIKIMSGANGVTYLSLEGISFKIEEVKIGDYKFGGYVFYLADPPADLNGDGELDRGLVAAPNEYSGAYPWGCQSTIIPGANSTEIGDGYENSLAISNNCNTSDIAAKLTLAMTINNYTDWFLPSLDELMLMEDNIGPDAPGPLNNIGNFQETYYWSSSQFTSMASYLVLFSPISETVAVFPKSNNYRIRGIRVF